MQGDVEAAIELFKEAVKRYPNREEGYLNLGSALMQNGEHEKASEPLMYAYKQIELRPADIYTYPFLCINNNNNNNIDSIEERERESERKRIRY